MSHAEQIKDQQLQHLIRELTTFLVTQFRLEHPAMVMDALLSAYLNVAHSSGRLGDIPHGVAALVTHPSVLAAIGQTPTSHTTH